jgi:hypothetical protein
MMSPLAKILIVSLLSFGFLLLFRDSLGGFGYAASSVLTDVLQRSLSSSRVR